MSQAPGDLRSLHKALNQMLGNPDRNITKLVELVDQTRLLMLSRLQDIDSPQALLQDFSTIGHIPAIPNKAIFLVGFGQRNWSKLKVPRHQLIGKL